MSVAEYMGEPDDVHLRYWDTYLLACRADNTKPNLNDFLVWLSEQDIDKDDGVLDAG
jgi:hypothetical protein